VVAALTKVGLVPQIEGWGRVVRQNPPPGTARRKGARCAWCSSPRHDDVPDEPRPAEGLRLDELARELPMAADVAGDARCACAG
jgi:hypothetical protein